MTIKAYKLRIYPNKAQKFQMEKNFGMCRFVWNQLLAMQNARYENGGDYVNEFGMNYLFKPLKREYPWLKEADATSLMTVSHNLHLAFKKLFKKQGGRPKFKAKRYTRPAYRSNAVNHNIVLIDDQHIRLPKLGSLAFRSGQLPAGTIKTATVTRKPTGKYYVLVTTEVEIKKWDSTGANVGLDMGVSDLVITSDSKKFATKRFDKALAPKNISGRSD